MPICGSLQAPFADDEGLEPDGVSLEEPGERKLDDRRHFGSCCGTRCGAARRSRDHGEQLKLLTGIQIGSSEPATVTPAAAESRPTSSARFPERGGGAIGVPASTAPPGSDTSPAWARRPPCRTVIGMVSPLPSAAG